MRPPLMPLDAAGAEELFAALEAAGFDFPQAAAAQ
jgi:hypothetical protein